MEIRVLGPLSLLDESGEPVVRQAKVGALPQPSAPKQQLLLLLLARHPGRIHTWEQIFEHCWGDAEVVDPKNRVERTIHDLRAVLRVASGRDCVRTSDDGYALELSETDTIDYLVYKQMLDRARRTEDRTERLRLATEALTLWRGDPPQVLNETTAGEQVRLEMLRSLLDGETLRLESLRDAHGSEATLEALSDLTQRYPDEEQLILLRMEALVDAGRAREAVKAFELYEDRASSIGVRPGEPVRKVYRQAKGAQGGQSKEPPFDWDAALRSYLSRVIRASSRLRVGDVTTDPGDGPGQGSMTLDRVWTPLRVALPPRHPDRIDTRTDEVGVLEALDSEEYHRAVVLGRPGSGKSTVVSYRTHQLAAAALSRKVGAPVPIHVRLPSLAPTPDLDDIWIGVYEAYAGEKVDDRLTRGLVARLEAGTACLLFDGLDEVQEEQLVNVRAVIELCAQAYPRAPLVVTCRSFDYAMDYPSRKLPFPTIELLPFELPQQLEYIEHWYSALSLLDSDRGLTQRRQNLQRTLEDSPSLIEMGQTPLLLALMTLVHTQDGELPEARAVLYRRTIGHLLAETALWREHSGGSTIASQDTLLLAARVGFEYHRVQETAPTEFRGMTEPQLFEVTAQHFNLYSTPPGTKAREKASTLVKDHVLRLIQGNGLLLPQGGGCYDFAFKQYREFLAGLFLNTMIDEDDSLLMATRPHWHECFQLLASHEAGGSTNITQLLYFIKELGDESRESPKFQASDAVLAAEMLHEIGKDKLLSLNQGRVLSDDGGRGVAGLWAHTTRGLLPVLSGRTDTGSASADLRIRAGLALGRLGDPRIAAKSGASLPLVDRSVAIPAALAVVGSKDREPSGRRILDAAQIGPREVSLPAYRISRYLTTNLEFAEFVEDGGYLESRWWSTPEAAAWRSDDADFIDRLQRLWLDTAEENYGKELQEGYYTLADLEATSTDLCRSRRGPFFASNARFNAPNQPVVGVNFWEARAYCEWLTDRGHREGWLSKGIVARLPTEWEWEHAANPATPRVTYPWGDEWDPSRARNRLDGTALNQASPIGCYPKGTWGDGPEDMAGNVWEWTASRLLGYETEHDAHRNDPSGLMERAIRGSSWYDKDAVEHCRCYSRFVDLPGNVYFDLGFRVVLGQHEPIS